MPSINVKTKTGMTHEVAFKVEGSIDSLTQAQVASLVEASLRSRARQYVNSAVLNAEPALVANKGMLKSFADFMVLSAGKTQEEAEGLAAEFAKKSNMVTSMPSQIEIPISELVPSENARGRAAANIFEFGGTEDETEE